MGADLETRYNLERDVTGDSLKELKEEINEPIQNSSEEEQNSSEKKEKSFTFKPIAASLAESQINNWETWDNNLTTTVEFAWWWKILVYIDMRGKTGINMQHDLTSELKFLVMKI